MDLIRLKSVNCFINTSTGIVYPYTKNETPNFEHPINLNNQEMIPDWWLHLSPLDYLVVQRWEYWHTHFAFPNRFGWASFYLAAIKT